jgi:hypothetical protein
MVGLPDRILKGDHPKTIPPKSSVCLVLVGSMLLIFLVFSVVLLCVSLHSEFPVVMSITILHKNDVRFVFTSSWLFYLRYLCLFAHSGVQHILYCVASFSGLSIFYCSFGILTFILLSCSCILNLSPFWLKIKQ